MKILTLLFVTLLLTSNVASAEESEAQAKCEATYKKADYQTSINYCLHDQEKNAWKLGYAFAQLKQCKKSRQYYLLSGDSNGIMNASMAAYHGFHGCSKNVRMAISLIEKAIEQHKCSGGIFDDFGTGCISPSYELIFLRSVYFACNGNDFRNVLDDECNHTINSSLDLFQSKIGMEQIKNTTKRNNMKHSGWVRDNIDPKIDAQLYNLFTTQSGVAFEGLKKTVSENLTNADELVIAKNLSSYGKYLARHSEEAKEFVYNFLLEKTWKTEAHKGLLPAYLADLHYTGIRVIKDEVEAYRLYLIARKYGSGGILGLSELDEKLSIEQKEKAICLAKKEELETTFLSKLLC